jgi:2'-5' RNA ligase
MLPPDGQGQTLGHFALVSYIPNPLARFLDDLRSELTPGCNSRAHITALPPRPLLHDVKDTVYQIAEDNRGIPPFWIELGDVQVFEGSHVVYIELARGARELAELYRALNAGPLKYEECFPYHPHITLAQGIKPEDSVRLAALARERWAEYAGPRGFLLSSLSFVQQVAPGIWADVAALPLAMLVPVG